MSNIKQLFEEYEHIIEQWEPIVLINSLSIKPPLFNKRIIINDVTAKSIAEKKLPLDLEGFVYYAHFGYSLLIMQSFS